MIDPAERRTNSQAFHPSPEGTDKELEAYFDSLQDLPIEAAIVNPRSVGVQVFLKKLSDPHYPHGPEGPGWVG